MRDELGTFYCDEDFAELYPQFGQPALAPWRLALVTIMQFMEKLTDRQAADAVRSRIDWKYALGLALDDPGFNFSVLSEFRTRLIEGNAETRLLDIILDRLVECKLIKKRGKQRTDSTHVIAAVHTLTRLEIANETLRHALNCVAEVEPTWLKAHLDPIWFERYSERLNGYRLPKKDSEREALAEVIGQDGYRLLSIIYADEAPSHLRYLPAIEILRQVWVQMYYIENDQVQWRSNKNIPPAARVISSPYDVEARYAVKNETDWVGYKAHLTETCDEDHPNLITHVATTPATTQDIKVVDQIHADLAERDLTPSQHIVDAGYVSADKLADSRDDHDIDLLGPVGEDTSWQARANQGYDLASFTVDWDAQRVTCPQGQTSSYWSPSVDKKGHDVVFVRFSLPTCRACACRPQCTRTTKYSGRELTMPSQRRYHALKAARHRQETEEFKETYKQRASVEGTISQAVNPLGMRRSRYIGLTKTHLQHVITAAAMNVMRAVAWLEEKPRAQTRMSPFATLAAA